MIVSFADRDTKRLFEDDVCPARWQSIMSVALRKLDLLHASTSVSDLRSPAGNRLEALKGDRKGQYSIRINQQWRLCFRWTSDGPNNVEIVDYH